MKLLLLIFYRFATDENDIFQEARNKKLSTWIKNDLLQ